MICITKYITKIGNNSQINTNGNEQ